MTDLTGKHAIVTGAASGIGRATAQHLASLGATVTIADVDADATHSVAKELGGTPWVVDLADTTALDDLTLDADIVVNNAGIQHVASIPEFEPEAWRKIHRIMLEAPFLLLRAVMPTMIDRGWGRIINISSVHGLRASPYKSAYVAAKHGLEGLSKVAALEGGEHGVTSNCINPAYVRTPLVEQQIADQAKVHGIDESEVVEQIMLTESSIKELLEPTEVASLVGWLASDESRMVTAASYTMDGGWSAR